MNSGNVRIWRRSLWWALFKSNWARFSCHYGWLALGVVRPTTILSVDVAIFGLCDSGGVLSSKTVLCRTNCARLRFGDEWWMVGRCARGHILCFYNVWSFFFYNKLRSQTTDDRFFLVAVDHNISLETLFLNWIVRQRMKHPKRNWSLCIIFENYWKQAFVHFVPGFFLN